nr:hypothetical protein [Tanacetum cinerariifolium]
MLLDIHCELGNTGVSGGDEADRNIFIDLDEDLFQQANVDDEEDYTNMVDEEVVDREEHVVDDSEEAKTMDEIYESEFKEEDIPPIEPLVDMNDFHFEVDAHNEHVTNLGKHVGDDAGSSKQTAAVGVDNNNGVYLLAYAIVEAGSKSSCLWFLDLDLQPNSNFTCI